MRPAVRLLSALRLALVAVRRDDQQRLIWAWWKLAEPTDPTGRVLLLLLLLLRRDEAGEPDPISLAELDTQLGCTDRQRRAYLQAALAAGWPIRQQSLGSHGQQGRAPDELRVVWSLLPGEPLIV